MRTRSIQHLRAVAVTVCLLGALNGTSAAQDAAPSTPDENPLGGLAWLEGSWHGEGLGGEIEEHWSAASGGTMIGSFRLVSGGTLGVIEYLMITREKDRTVYRFKHFRNDFTTREEHPLEFTLTELRQHEAIFHSEVPDQHSPRRLTYRLLEDGTMSVRVQGSSEQGELDEGFEVSFRRR